MDAFGDVFAVFRKYDSGKRGFLTSKEIQTVLQDLFLYVSEQQLKEIIDRYVGTMQWNIYNLILNLKP